MRAAPAIQVLLRQFSVWQAASFSLLLGAECSLGAWLFGRDVAPGPPAIVALIASAVALLALAVSLGSIRAVRLAWDGQCWTVQAALPTAAAPAPGDVSVAVDLGLWMLLRFRPHAASRWSAPHWLPVQRRGIEAHWHGLRCAVYSPQARDVQRAVADQ